MKLRKYVLPNFFNKTVFIDKFSGQFLTLKPNSGDLFIALKFGPIERFYDSQTAVREFQVARPNR